VFFVFLGVFGFWVRVFQDCPPFLDPSPSLLVFRSPNNVNASAFSEVLRSFRLDWAVPNLTHMRTSSFGQHIQCRDDRSLKEQSSEIADKPVSSPSVLKATPSFC